MLFQLLFVGSVFQTIPFLILSLPIYFIAKGLEKRMNPRKSLQKFLVWIGIVLVASLGYFYTIIYVAKLIKWNLIGL